MRAEQVAEARGSSTDGRTRGAAAQHGSRAGPRARQSRSRHRRSGATGDAPRAAAHQRLSRLLRRPPPSLLRLCRLNRSAPPKTETGDGTSDRRRAGAAEQPTPAGAVCRRRRGGHSQRDGDVCARDREQGPRALPIGETESVARGRAAVEDGFRAVTSQRVKITILSIDRRGDEASVRPAAPRHDSGGRTTADGESQQTMTLSRTRRRLEDRRHPLIRRRRDYMVEPHR